MIHIVGIGETLIDFTCDSLQEDGYPTLDAHPGGGVLNFLATTAKYGAFSSIITKVGNDAFGRLLVDTVEKCGIDRSSLIVTNDAFTTLAFVTRDDKGDRSFSFARKPGADTLLTVDEIDFNIIDEAKVVHFSSVGMTTEPSRSTHKKVIEYAKSKGKIISFDPNYRKLLWENPKEAKEEILWGISKADIIKISDNEVEFLFNTFPENGAQIILDNYDAKLVYVTLGPKGCFYATRNCCNTIPTQVNVTPIDTTGAGDIFGGSAMYKFLKLNKSIEELTKDDLDEICKFACKAASLSTQKLGGVSSIPHITEI